MIIVSILILAIMLIHFYLLNNNEKENHFSVTNKLQSKLNSLEAKNKMLQQKMLINANFNQDYRVNEAKIRNEIIVLQNIVFQNIASKK